MKQELCVNINLFVSVKKRNPIFSYNYFLMFYNSDELNPTLIINKKYRPLIVTIFSYQ